MFQCIYYTWGLCAPTPRTPFLSLCFWARQRERNGGKKEKPRHNRLITTKLTRERANSLRSDNARSIAVSLSGDYKKLRALCALKI